MCRKLKNACGLIGSDQSAVAMRIGAQLASVSSHFCPGAAPQVGQRMASTSFGLSPFFITNLACTTGGQFETSFWKPLWPGLRFRGDGHRPTLQEGDDRCAIYLQAAVVVDEALLLELIHKFTYPSAGGTNHLREGRLAHLQGVLRL
jgi:hypothetical protein